MRSFVLRTGRLTQAQARALEHHWPRFGVQVGPGVLLPAVLAAEHDGEDSPAGADPAALFDGPPAPITLDIGFGDGSALAQQAAQEPGVNFLGIEVHTPGVGHLLHLLADGGVSNVRVISHDAIEVMACLPAASLRRVQLFFPDPWPKKRHHKRRIVQPDFVAEICRLLAPGGIFHAATDWAPYAEHMLEVLEAEPRLQNLAGAGAWHPRPAARPLTKFEQRGQRLGHAVADLLYQRQPERTASPC